MRNSNDITSTVKNLQLHDQRRQKRAMSEPRSDTNMTCTPNVRKIARLLCEGRPGANMRAEQSSQKPLVSPEWVRDPSAGIEPPAACGDTTVGSARTPLCKSGLRPQRHTRNMPSPSGFQKKGPRETAPDMRRHTSATPATPTTRRMWRPALAAPPTLTSGQSLPLEPQPGALSSKQNSPCRCLRRFRAAIWP